MFKRRSYFKSKSPYRSSYFSKRKKRNAPPLGAILLSLPLILIFLEILARVALGISGEGGGLASNRGEPAIVTAYRLKFLSRDRQPLTGLGDGGELAAYRNLSVGYKLAPSQKHPYWQINEQGFRDEEPVPLAKPNGEVRVFVLGNSVAFGAGSLSNEATISSKLETRLQQRIAQQQGSPQKYRPDTLSFYKPERDKSLALPPKIRPGTYRAIDAAVPGYTSGNHLAQLALEILPYQPDAIVVLGGYTDLMLPADKTATTIPKLERFLSDPSRHYWASLSQSARQWAANLALSRMVGSWTSESQASLEARTLGIWDEDKPLAQHLAADDEELERRIQRYRENYKQLIQLCAGAGIPLVLALQPEITGRSAEVMVEQEKEIVEQLGQDYQQRVQTGYEKLARAHDQLKKAYPNNVYIYNFYRLYEKTPDRVFEDPIHLTEAANEELAKRLYDGLTSVPKMQVIPKNAVVK
ncbi:MAG: SGNH/GDSL hydrolase family protein [Cyanobacteriota bacterium]|nr:SGNH/GDSL hydrolase family protein [Cyanobacteriota bacterium]